MVDIPGSYYDVLAFIESGGNPDAHSPSSSASGLFQFTKGTATSLGLPWGTNSSLPFGGANVSVTQQLSAIQQLTEANAVGLQNHGVPVNSGSLYAAHFLGLGTATDVLTSSPDTQLSDILSPSVLSANPFLQNMSVSNFESWLGQKTGTDPQSGAEVPGSSGGNFLGRVARGVKPLWRSAIT